MMMRRSFFLLLMVFMSLTGSSQNREEFNGPFSGWINVKARFGAKGDGKTDDTRAIQSAINFLSNPVTKYNVDKGRFMVLYFPAGTYCISSTLELKGKIGVSLIGEEPANTTFRWIGSNKATMFLGNGSAYYRIARFTWNANQKKDIEAIGIHWKEKWNDGVSKSFATVNIEISDCEFKGGLAFGISGGTSQGSTGTGENDSEVTIKRCKFEDCSAAGIDIRGYNALDYWIWDCRFLRCGSGVDSKFGNYHIYRSYFNSTHYADLHNTNGYYTSARGCYSENSGGFSLDDGSSCNPFKRIFQDNTVVKVKKSPIEFFHTGKLSLWGNSFDKAQDPALTYVVKAGSWCPANYGILSIQNTYGIKEPFNNKWAMKRYGGGDKYATTVKSFDFLKTMEPTPPLRVRKVFEVPSGANARTIQDLIDKASKLAGSRPIIHFAAGEYMIDKTLVIPAGSDVQLIGDGLLYASVLTSTASFGKNSPVLAVKGPSYITIRDLQIGSATGKDALTAISFSNVDQPSSQAHIDQLYSQAQTSLITRNLNYLYIEKNNSFFSAGHQLQGGSLVKQNKGTAKVCCYGGQFAGLNLSNGARFMAKDCWWEGNERVPLQLNGSGNISLDGAMIAPLKADSLPSVRISNFSGNISLTNMYLQGSLANDDSRTALNLLLWNIHFYYKMNVPEYVKAGPNSRVAIVGATAQCFDNSKACENVISTPDKVYNIPDVNSFIEQMTETARFSRPVPFTNLPSGVSNIYISRVSVIYFPEAIVFTN